MSGLFVPPLTRDSFTKKHAHPFSYFVRSSDFPTFGLLNVLWAVLLHHRRMTILCRVIRSGSQWMSSSHGTSSSAPGAVSLSPFLLMPRPEFPHPAFLSTLGWPPGWPYSPSDTMLTMKRASPPFCRGVSLVQKPFQHLLFQGGQECRRAARVLCDLTILPGLALCTCCSPRGLLSGEGGGLK